MKELKKAIPMLIVLIYFMVGMILILMPSMVSAKLSDDTLEEVENLRWKHYYYYKGELACLISIKGDNILRISDNTITWSSSFLRMWVEDGIFYVETQDGKWFIEMEKVKE